MRRGEGGRIVHASNPPLPSRQEKAREREEDMKGESGAQPSDWSAGPVTREEGRGGKKRTQRSETAAWRTRLSAVQPHTQTHTDTHASTHAQARRGTLLLWLTTALKRRRKKHKNSVGNYEARKWRKGKGKCEIGKRKEGRSGK